MIDDHDMMFYMYMLVVLITVVVEGPIKVSPPLYHCVPRFAKQKLIQRGE